MSPFLLLLWTAVADPAGAAVAPSASPVQEKAYRDPDLFVRVLERPLAELDTDLAAGLESELSSLGASSNDGFYDWRAGGWGSLILSVPLVPGDGKGNSLGAPGAFSQADVWEALSRFLQEHRAQLRVDLAELGRPRVDIFEGGNLVHVHAPRVLAGIPVRDSGLSAVINHGNLILLGIQGWGAVGEVADLNVGLADARAATEAHLQPFAVARYRDEGHLELVPMARGDEVPSVTRGQGYAFRLAWVVNADVVGDMGRWEALVDASTGKLIAFQDTNQYAVRRAVGGVYPVSNDQRPPDGIEQAGWPMPFANITSGSGPFTTTSAGVVPGCVTGSMTTTLAGQYVRMSDVCGAINESSAGDIDLGISGGDDCTIPAGHSAGDTHSSRSGFYELNRIKEQARAYLPSNTWLTQQLTSNMNINQSCNAFWNGSTVNFYRSNATCGNTGEIAAIFDHEWGHGMDDFGTNGNISSPGEAIADIYAILRLDQSCVGRGFFLNQVCGGYGDQCDGTVATGCTGVRDSDFMNHRCDRPHGITWILSGFTSAQCNNTGAAPACPGGGQLGPCNRETHCEGQIAAEVGWDLQFRDLQAAPFNYDSNTALELTTRLMFLGPQTLTSWYSCGAGCAAAGTCGCGATGGYLLTLAADDDNGSIADGTPHMSAIRAAFQRHEIHCATQTVIDSGCAGGPTAAPTVIATPGPGVVNLSWNAVPGAASYHIYKTEGLGALGCDFGKVRVGTTAGTTFSDTAVLDGRQYFYGVLPVGSNSSCFGLMSACASATPSLGPDPCGGGNTVEFNFSSAASSVAENGGSASISVTLTTSDSLPSSAPSSVDFNTFDGTATGGSDYTPNAGTLNFPAGTANGATQSFNVTILDDPSDEPDETFGASLTNPVGGTVGGVSNHTATILDDDASPDLSIGDAAVTEGNAGTTTALFPVTLSAASGSGVTADFATADGSASVADNDYQPLAGTVVFGPGETLKNVTISVVGDLAFEADETYFVSIGNVTGANVVDGVGDGLIINDDFPLATDSRTELIHGSKLARSLAAAGSVAIQDFFPIQSKARQSWEVVVDGTGGDIGTGGPNVVRLDSDGTTVVQTATSIGAGSSKSLRWENSGAADFNGYVRVESAGCTTTCTAEDVYRLRAYETTYAIPRFNNSATQVTILVIQNTSTDTVAGTVWLWNAAGALANSQALTLAPNATFVVNTSTLASGAGTITVSHDGRYGSLAGKAVAVEAATGFTFDTAMTPRGR